MARLPGRFGTVGAGGDGDCVGIQLDPATIGMVMKIPLVNGGFATIDEKDAELVSSYRWHARKRRHCLYAIAYRYVGDYRHISIYMHRLILDAGKGVVVDHVNGDGLDNRRSNIRLCTPMENSRNQHTVWGISKYKGVTWDKERNKWLSQIRVRGKQIFLGRFNSELDAALSYDDAATKYFGSYARPNF